jgi:hypothetical protein
MGHAEIENKTPFAFEVMHLLDEEARPIVTALVKGTFQIDRGYCTVAEKQIPVNTGGECNGEDPATSSYKYEPEVAFFKGATDVVLIGHAYAPRSGTTQMLTTLQVGPVAKQVNVFGDRGWYAAGGQIGASRPNAFEKMPLIYERAAGGWDKSDPNRDLHTCELRNPVGVGYRGRRKVFEEGLRLPNLEDPRDPIRAFGDCPMPAGFGFISPHWYPRAQLAGTYDEAWQKGRAPLLPKDFDRRHLNAASLGLIANGYLRGDEQVTATGVTPEGHWSFALPGVPPPAARVVLVSGKETVLPAQLDTVILEPDEQRVMLLWRCHMALRTGPHDLRAIHVSPQEISANMGASNWR